MRRIALALIPALLLGALPLGAQSTTDSTGTAVTPAEMETAVELLRLLEMEKVMQASMQATLEAQIATQPQLEPFRDVMLAWAEKSLAWDRVGDRFARLYAEMFTESELREIVAFYRTPVGRKLAERTPELTRRGMELGELIAQENRAELEAMVEARVKELQERPPSPR